MNRHQHTWEVLAFAQIDFLLLALQWPHKKRNKDEINPGREEACLRCLYCENQSFVSASTVQCFFLVYFLFFFCTLHNLLFYFVDVLPTPEQQAYEGQKILLVLPITQFVSCSFQNARRSESCPTRPLRLALRYEYCQLPCL